MCWFVDVEIVGVQVRRWVSRFVAVAQIVGVQVRSSRFVRFLNKIVSVWCAADRNEALTKAKGGADPELKTCPNPVAEEFELGRRIGVAGTPAIFAEDGSQIGGYLTVDQMVSRLDTIK